MNGELHHSTLMRLYRPHRLRQSNIPQTDFSRQTVGHHELARLRKEKVRVRKTNLPLTSSRFPPRCMCTFCTHAL